MQINNYSIREGDVIVETNDNEYLRLSFITRLMRNGVILIVVSRDRNFSS